MVTLARRISLLLAVALLALGVAAAAHAAPVLEQDFESGLSSPDGTWTATGFWHAQASPEAIAVKSPEINPGMVTIPGANLPAAFGGNQAAWFGEASTGTFCGPGWSVVQAPKSGCTSTTSYTGELTSPSFSLVGAISAILRFRSWWEIEGVNANDYDVMQVEYSTDDGATWRSTGKLNPANNPAGRHDESYSNNGLRAEPSWKAYLVDLSAAIGAPNVKVRFSFATRDHLYNGFRGWLVDDVVVSTPFDASAPVVSDVTTCNGLQPASIWVAHGANFVQGSRIFLDGAEDLRATMPAPDRIELQPRDAGQHTLRVVSPNGTESNAFPFASGNCAQQTPGPSGAEKRPSVTQVFCNYIVASETDTCTATVADATGGGRVPTGTVRFMSANGGAFLFGDTCQLRKNDLSTVASCTIEGFRPARGRPLAVTGSYSGDDGLEPSGGATQFLMASPGSGAYLQTIEPFRAFGAPNGPHQPTVTITVDNPAAGADVEGDASISSNGTMCNAGFGAARASGALAAAAAASSGDPLATAARAKKKGKARGRRRGRARNRRKRVTVPGLRYRAPKVKRIDAVVVSRTKRNAKAGKVKLKLTFNRRKLARKFGRRKRLTLVVRITLDFDKGQPAIVYRELTLKRVKKGRFKVVRDSGSATAQPARAVRPARAARGGAPGASAAQTAAVHRWVGGDDCNRLTVAAQFDQGPTQGPLVGFHWQGWLICFGADALPLNYAPPNGVRGTLTSARSVDFSMAEFTNPGYNLSGTLYSGSATVSGRIGGLFAGNVACQATAPPVLTQVQ